MTDAPASLPERLADAEGELPEEIVKAIEDLQRWAILLGGLTAGAVFKVQEVRAALTATILARLTAAESARDAVRIERDMFSHLNELLRQDKVVALTRAERAEKALEPMAEAISEILKFPGGMYAPALEAKARRALALAHPAPAEELKP